MATTWVSGHCNGAIFLPGNVQAIGITIKGCFSARLITWEISPQLNTIKIIGNLG